MEVMEQLDSKIIPEQRWGDLKTVCGKVCTKGGPLLGMSKVARAVDDALTSLHKAKKNRGGQFHAGGSLRRPRGHRQRKVAPVAPAHRCYAGSQAGADVANEADRLGLSSLAVIAPVGP